MINGWTRTKKVAINGLKYIEILFVNLVITESWHTLSSKSCVRISQDLAMLLCVHSSQQEMSCVGVANKSSILTLLGNLGFTHAPSN